MTAFNLLRRHSLRLALAAALFVPAGFARAHDGPAGHTHDHDPHAASPAKMEAAAAEMAAAAQAFWAALTPEQQKTVMYEFKSDERLNWHFVPKERKGLPIKDMTPAQRNLAYALLATGMSNTGFAKVQQIQSLEAVLKEMEKNPRFDRNPELYFVTFFGKPDAKETWGWRYEGHHLSINFTVAGGKVITALPTFMGTNPGEVRETQRKGLRVLAAEEDQGRKLIKALDEAQKKKAVIAEKAPADIITMAERKIDLNKVVGNTPGIPASELKPEQREQLLLLIEVYARRHRGEVADAELRKIHVAGFDKVSFAWAGGVEVGEPHYYRIHGPTFLVEYDNTQNNANHLHTVWRDPANDFGEDILKKHYETDPHHKK